MVLKSWKSKLSKILHFCTFKSVFKKKKIKHWFLSHVLTEWIIVVCFLTFGAIQISKPSLLNSGTLYKNRKFFCIIVSERAPLYYYHRISHVRDFFSIAELGWTSQDGGGWRSLERGVPSVGGRCRELEDFSASPELGSDGWPTAYAVIL